MEKKIIDFANKYLHLEEKEINGATRLEEDLFIYGEDAEYLLIEYSDLFNVDITNLDFSKYFSQERIYFYMLYRRYSKRYKQKKDLTINDLERGITYGRLDDEIISME